MCVMRKENVYFSQTLFSAGDALSREVRHFLNSIGSYRPSRARSLPLTGRERTLITQGFLEERVASFMRDCFVKSFAR